MYIRMYKSKPDRYDLKIISLNDANTSYIINAISYLGKVRAQNESVPDFFFREVTKSIYKTNKTITIDNWFTSSSLMERMLEPEFNVTIIGKP